MRGLRPGTIGASFGWRKPVCVCYNGTMKKEHIGSDFDDFLEEGSEQQSEVP
jgi:hypothetical protein